MGLLQKHWNSKSGTSINVIKLLMSFISRVFILPFRSILTCVRLDYQLLFGRRARAPRPLPQHLETLPSIWLHSA